jgi:hypothetical protein
MQGPARRKLRQDVREVLAAQAEFSGWAVLKSWAQPQDESAYPALGVMTPREVVDGLDGTTLRRDTDLVVHLAITGSDDLEDEIETHADTAEAVVYAVLQDRDQPLFGLVSIDFDIKDAGDIRLGTATLLFRETRYSPEPNC